MLGKGKDSLVTIKKSLWTKWSLITKESNSLGWSLTEVMESVQQLPKKVTYKATGSQKENFKGYSLE